MKKYIYCPFIADIHYDTDVQYDSLEYITDYSIKYAVLDALSLEYYFSVEIH